MSTSAKLILIDAKKAEAQGDARNAARLFASLGMTLRKAGRLEEAERLLTHAVHLHPASPKIVLQLAILFALTDRRDAAVGLMDKVSARVIRSKRQAIYEAYFEVQLADLPYLRERYYRAALELDRTEGRRFLGLARAMKEQGNLAEAMKAALDALRTKSCDDESVALVRDIASHKNDSTTLERVADFLDGRLSRKDLLTFLEPTRPRQLGKPVEAEEPEEKSLKQLIGDLEAELGVALEDPNDQVEPLVKEFRRLSKEVIGGHTKTRMDLSLAFFEMGLTAEACDELKSIEESDPLFLEAQCLLGEVLAKSGSELAALDVYQRCRRDSRAGEIVRSEATYRIAAIYLRLSDRKRALRELKELEREHPGYRDTSALRRELEAGSESVEGLGRPGPRARNK